ncbi:MAG: hypothetical protein K2P57_01270 [Burkholderiales bacterium]|nr:hypothetical protein [Burkholderiales bacterium]
MITQRHKDGMLALFLGFTINFFGDRLLGVHIELFHGLSTFSFLWFLDVFVLPFFAGFCVALVFGLGGKWMCYFPPLAVRLLSYYLFTIDYWTVPEGHHLMPMGWWGFFVILAIEASAFGGILGEVYVKSTYGRRPRELLYKSKQSSDEK